MNARELSRELRQGSGQLLERRRNVVGLSLLASAMMGAVTLYQTGLVRHLPEPPLPFLNADKVDAAPEAYSRAGLPVPDAALGLVSYAVTAALAATGGPGRERTAPIIPLALGVKVAADALNGGYLTWEQVAKHRAVCSYCLVAAVASAAMVPQALPEARAAYANWRRQRA